MIKIFRKIRQKLISENLSARHSQAGKFSKYLIYAIGEIILVVIGILIALQINNWNEARKSNQSESLILHEILNSINKDLQYYEDVVDPLIERKQRGLDSLEDYIFNKKTIQDSLFSAFYYNANQDLVLFFDNGPFEALKSSGLNLISNDSLRSAINDVYTVRLPSYTNFANTRNDDGKSEISELKRKFLKLEPREDAEIGRYGRHVPQVLKVDDILNNQDFLWVYNLQRLKHRDYKYWLGRMKTDLSDLKSKIEKELKK